MDAIAFKYRIISFVQKLRTSTTTFKNVLSRCSEWDEDTGRSGDQAGRVPGWLDCWVTGCWMRLDWALWRAESSDEHTRPLASISPLMRLSAENLTNRQGGRENPPVAKRRKSRRANLILTRARETIKFVNHREYTWKLSGDSIRLTLLA